MSTDLAVIEGQLSGRIDRNGHDMTVSSDSQSAQAVARVQASMAIAKRFPRDEDIALDRIVTRCKRPTMAKGAWYSYPRGDKVVSGPSIRLAETMAQCWGNVSFGYKELDTDDEGSLILAYCHDMETNTQREVEFYVRHEVRLKDKSMKKLKDPRDIYEHVASMGQRRLRMCILNVLPGYVQDAAVDQVLKTRQGDADIPLEDRIRRMLDKFKPYGVTKAMLEQRLGHPLSEVSEDEMNDMFGIFHSLKDGMSKVDVWFERNQRTAETGEADSRLKDKPKRKKATRKKVVKNEPEHEPVEPEPVDLGKVLEEEPEMTPQEQMEAQRPPTAPTDFINPGDLLEQLQLCKSPEEVDELWNNNKNLLHPDHAPDVADECDFVKDALIATQSENDKQA